MDERIKRLLYLTEFDNKKDKKLIKENADVLFESKQTEQQAAAMLKLLDERTLTDLINKFKTVDLSKNQVLLPIMAKSYLEVGNRGLNELLILFKSVSELMNTNKITTPQISDVGFIINNKTFKDYLSFAEFIHGLEGMSKGHAEWKGRIDLETDEAPIFEGNGIKVYDGNDVGKCIKYTTGGLTGKHYGFCIGQPANTMWQSYRDSKTSTFYYIIDQNRELSDPLHIIVLDYTEHGIELTDANNNTGTIVEYGSDVNSYLKYLSSKGVPTNIFVNKEKTDAEKEEQKKLGGSEDDLEVFKNHFTYEEKSKYIGRGHILTNEQFNYLWNFKNDKGGYHLLHQYVDTGQAIPEAQFNVLVGEQ